MNELDVKIKWSKSSSYNKTGTKKIVFKILSGNYNRYYGLSNYPHDSNVKCIECPYPIHQYWESISTFDARTMWKHLIKAGFGRYYIEDDYLIWLIEEENGDW